MQYEDLHADIEQGRSQMYRFPRAGPSSGCTVVFKEEAERELIELGYEKDAGW